MITTFIEASWVSQPAYKGSFLVPSLKLLQRIDGIPLRPNCKLAIWYNIKLEHLSIQVEQTEPDGDVDPWEVGRYNGKWFWEVNSFETTTEQSEYAGIRPTIQSNAESLCFRVLQYSGQRVFNNTVSDFNQERSNVFWCKVLSEIEPLLVIHQVMLV